MQPSLFVVLAFAATAAMGGWVYFRRVRINRPPIGVANLRDAVILMMALVLMPYLYLWLPLVVVTALLAVIVLTGLHMTLEPVLRNPLLLWSACLGLILADIVIGLGQGVTSTAFLLVNNVILVVVVIGATNLWAQSGMRARDVTILAGALMVYDLIATWHLSVMTDVFQRLANLPLVPVVGWGLGNPSTSLRLGLGDLLLVTVFPLVLRKAFGLKAGLIALGSALAVLALILTLLTTGTVTVSIPVMVVLGPMFIAQYIWWGRARGAERTTSQYLRSEPLALAA